MGRIRLSLLCLLLSTVSASLPAASEDGLPGSLFGTRWYGLYLKGDKSGWMRVSLEARSDRYLLDSETVFAVAAFGDQASMRVTETRTYARHDRRLLSVITRIVSAGSEQEFEAGYGPAGFGLTRRMGGSASTTPLPSPSETIDDYLVLELNAAHGRLSTAFAATARVFDTGAGRELEGRVGILSAERFHRNGIETPVYRAVLDLPERGTRQEVVLTGDGTVLESVVSGFLKARLEDERTARDLSSGGDVLLSTMVRPDRPIERPDRLERLAFRLRGLPAGLKPPASGHQTLGPAGQDGWRAGVRTRAPSRTVPAIPDAALLAATPFIQSDATEIVRTAARIGRGSSGPDETYRRIIDWVFDNIRKRYTPSVANALDTLRRLEGDCGEHAALTVALLRASGIPAREVAGLVYVASSGNFGYHAWVTAQLDGRWLEADPTFGQHTADATHIALVEGGYEEQLRLTGAIGNIEIRIDATSQRP